MAGIFPFVLCGGAGTRLWPLSRDSFPKQFHEIGGGETLFQQTCIRLQDTLFEQLSIITNYRHRFLIADQLEKIGLQPRRIVLEPVGRNTAPAAAIASLISFGYDPDSLVLLVPSDHLIRDKHAFGSAVNLGISAATEGALVTFGIEPSCPHTGYGYIKTQPSNSPHLKVTRFVEKPARKTAEALLSAGGSYWNAGIFLFKSATLVNILEAYAPDVLAACRLSLEELKGDLGFLRLNGAYTRAPAISLDYAVAEKADNIRCVPLNTPWSDIGSWSSVWSVADKDSAGNVVLGEGEVLFEQTSESLAYSDGACVAVVGLKDVLVVSTDDAVLVASKEHAEDVKKVVDHLKANGRAHAFEHSRVYRPWGWYQTLNRGDRYQVKCIMVKPGAKLSLQSHFHRSEHWIVVRGTLEVTRGDEVELLSENQSTYIPIGKKHRLSNPGKIPAFLIEVQSGSYLDEDDIVRFDDMYDRIAAE